MPCIKNAPQSTVLQYSWSSRLCSISGQASREAMSRHISQQSKRVAQRQSHIVTYHWVLWCPMITEKPGQQNFGPDKGRSVLSSINLFRSTVAITAPAQRPTLTGRLWKGSSDGLCPLGVQHSCESSAAKVLTLPGGMIPQLGPI